MEDSFDFVPPTSVLAPAIMAVAAVNVVIVAYVIKAFRWPVIVLPCATKDMERSCTYLLFCLPGKRM